MIFAKTVLAGVVGVSFCMGDISGTVTDTGTMPITGAFVKLENGGQTATTDFEGRFTLVIPTAVLPGKSTPLPNGLSARISGAMLNVTIVQRAAVAIITFDLDGRVLSTMRQTLDAGTYSFVPPYRRAGIYIYTVKSGNREFVLKNNAAGGISYARQVRSHGSPSISPMKHATIAAAMKDVIAATKTGYLNYRVEIRNPDTSGMVIQMIACAGTLTDADGNEYQTVRIGNQVWMAENLRVTKYNDGLLIPLDTSGITWERATTPKYCFYHNTTKSDRIKKYGALYNWYVVNPINPNTIAPTGWHVPSDEDWDTLQNYLIANGYNWDGTMTGNKIAKSLAAKADWMAYTTAGTVGCDLTKNNSSGFSALPGGDRDLFGLYDYDCIDSRWWSITEQDSLKAGDFELNYGLSFVLRGAIHKSGGLSIRLVRD